MNLHPAKVDNSSHFLIYEVLSSGPVTMKSVELMKEPQTHARVRKSIKCPSRQVTCQVVS